MFEFLVTSKTRQKLLRALWLEKAAGTVSDLARLTDVAYAGAHRELEAMKAHGLAEDSWLEGQRVFSADYSHPLSEVLMKLLRSKSTVVKRKPGARLRNLRQKLAYLGAPLSVDKETKPSRHDSLESLFVRGAQLARTDATLARALPVLYWRHAGHLDWTRLKALSREHNQKHAVGFFLELAGRLGQDTELVEMAKALHDDRRKSAQMFFFSENGSKLKASLAEARTPELARDWGWRMNMSMDSFRSTFERFNVAHAKTAETTH